MILAQPAVEAVAGEIGDVAGQGVGLGVERIADDDPADVGPPSALVRRVRVAFMVGKLVMDAMQGHPEDRAALERHGSADCHYVFQPFGNTVTPMREQAVVAHADADIRGEHPKHEGADEGLPREHEEGRDGADVEKDHEAGGEPVGSFFGLGFIAELRHPFAFAQLRLDCRAQSGRGGEGAILDFDMLDFDLIVSENFGGHERSRFHREEFAALGYAAVPTLAAGVTGSM